MTTITVTIQVDKDKENELGEFVKTLASLGASINTAIGAAKKAPVPVKKETKAEREARILKKIEARPVRSTK